MPSSPKRHGFIMDDENWPLRTPRLSLCASSSYESFEQLMPPTPKLEDTDYDPILLPGFHFSTTDASVDPAEFHRIAAQLLSGESTKRESAEVVADEIPTKERHLHCDLGKDPSGRHCCSCGKSYSTMFRLRGHIQQCAGTTNSPCLSCDKVFTTKEKLNRHVSTRHKSYMEACPECGEMFRADHLPKHLASGLGGCDAMVQVSNAPELDQKYDVALRKSTSQQYWIYDGDLRWGSTKHDSGFEDGEEVAVVEQTMDFVKRLLRRPEAQDGQVACDLCGEHFSSGDALAQHVGEHSLDFTEKSHKCDECRIFFANERDLERHLQSADLNQHCGFTFRHNAACDGHHPPTYFKSAVVNDHNLMQKHLWAWELCQLRSHRATVARLLAERLSQMTTPPMSAQNCKRTYISLLPHFSMASQESARSSVESGWVKDQDATELSALDAHFCRLIDEAYPQAAVAKLRSDRSDRPDSSVMAVPVEVKSERLSRRKTLIDYAKKTIEVKVKNGHKRHAVSASGFALLKTQAIIKEEGRPVSLPVGKIVA